MINKENGILETQTKQKYAICCSCYLYGQKYEIVIACNVIQFCFICHGSYRESLEYNFCIELQSG